MCGIAGEIRFDGRAPDKKLLTRSSERLAPRGPDSEGMVIEKNWGFVHRRLSIIDLSDAGNQPMQIPELGLTLVFNGEIYNYLDIRKELQDLGHHFNSHSDTETLLRGYAQWGQQVLEKMNGMFAFCIRDEKQKKYFIARDRLGIKPFYFSDRPQAFSFASNIRSLLCFDDIDTTIDPVSLHHYLSFHAVVPSPRTILSGVLKLDAGHFLEITFEGKKTFQQYWKPDYIHKKVMPERQWQEETEKCLRKAVKRRLIADVPVGVFLSGGVDSSLITALIAKSGQKNINTFSVGFEGAAEEAGDEFKYSNIIAEKFQTNHHRFLVKTDELLDFLPECIRQMNEPMVSYDNIGFYLLSKAASKHVKVVQSGQGADEVFGGYHWYPPMINSTNALKDYTQLFLDRSDEKMQETLNSDWYHENYAYNYVKNYFSKNKNLFPVDKALCIDTHVMLVEDPIKRVDSNTMAFGLEARVPFLDHELIELAAQMPPELKVQSGGKYILKNIARMHVPSEVIDRPKGYFPVPQLKYIEGPFLDFVKKYLTESNIKKRGIFQPQYVDKLLSQPKAHITALRGSELWQVALLEIWLQEQGIES
ncbi:MAG: N-acetylglutaminylglutamine amidotransferase [Halobacteriovoraceae bacterium]|nr:N-acetylglutaminylglutamine amidotransferase [Halobacteriovoraceae bacterium]MCB9095263.1 N-acetylglutaminylglutamine amidotransferase [Halobacteriovoraceae bacterium]